MTAEKLIQKLRAAGDKYHQTANFIERYLNGDIDHGEFSDESSSSTSSEDEDCQKIRQQAEDLAAVTAKLEKCRRELRKVRQ